MSTAARPLLRYLVATLVAQIGGSALTHVVLGTSYAGASDDATVRTGMALYGGYLREVGSWIAALVLCDGLLLSLLTSGLLVWLPHLRRPGLRAWPALFGMGTLVGVISVGYGAYRHPGLFLPLASTGLPGVLWVEMSGVAWPLLLWASCAGFLKIFVQLTRPVERASSAVGVLFVLAALGLGWDDASTPQTGIAPTTDERSPVGGAVRARPNVLLIGIDSLRPDKIDPQSTPNLARLLAQSIYFPNTVVTLPRTGPSWTALLTSLPPLENGVETMFPGGSRTDRTKIALPAHLRSLGYRTAVFSEYAGEFFSRVRLGFDEVDVPQVELREMMGQAFLARHPIALALASQLYTLGPWMRRHLPHTVVQLLRGMASFSHPEVLEDDFKTWLAHGPGRPPSSQPDPWFAVLFYSQPHFPYTSSLGFHAVGSVSHSDPSLRYGKDITRGEVRSPADREQIDRLYRSALAETDQAVGSLLGHLEETRALSDTIVILTADHGEGLYECPRCIGHGDNLDGLLTLRVPLAIRLPRPRWRVAGQTLETFVSQLDVYPTILELLDVPVPPTHEGQPLLGRTGDPNPKTLGNRDRTFFAETGEWLWPSSAVPNDRLDYPPVTQIAELESDRVVIAERQLPIVRAAKHRGAFCPPFLLVYEPTRDHADYHLYNLDEDPFARIDVGRRYPERAKQLKEALRRSVLRFPHMIEVDGYFLTRPDPPLEEYW